MSNSRAGLDSRSRLDRPSLPSSGLDGSDDTLSEDVELSMLDIVQGSLIYLGNLLISSSVFLKKSLIPERSSFNFMPL